MSYLSDIKNEVQQFAEAISAALHIESEIIDEDWEVVGSTSITFQDNQTEWNDDNAKLCKNVFKTRRPLLLTDPGENILCKNCIEKGRCDYKAGLYYPILLDGACHGVISLAAFTDDEKQQLVLNSYSYMKFTGRMAELLASKIQEAKTKEKLSKTNEYLSTIISSVHEGIIACNRGGIITSFNDTAQDLTGIDKHKAIGNHIETIIPDSILYEAIKNETNYSEVNIDFVDKNGNTMHLITNVSLVKQGESILGAVESFNTDESLFRIASRLMNSEDVTSFSNIIGESSVIKRAKYSANAITKSPSTVLITGESGTGKELFARAIHNASLRSTMPFVTVNCGAIPDTLIESELFGYEGGAFTGAKASGKPGLFEMANEGTIFLDEIGDMPLNLQVKILRVLQEKIITHIGSSKEIPVDVRVIAATNSNLHDKIKDGLFREDLYYRLNVIPINIPPLRERMTDIPLLVNFLCGKYASILNRNIEGISESALKTLCSYNWPGNVRELENAIEYAINYTFDCSIISDEALPNWVRSEPDLSDSFSLKAGQLNENEKLLIEKLLKSEGCTTESKKKIAGILDISLATLYRKLKKYGL
jgi:PAS domain S-box-containing protein